MRRLADVVAELTNEVSAITPKITLKVKEPRAKTTLSLILANYSEVLSILARIVEQQELCKTLQAPPGDKGIGMQLTFQIAPLLSLDIKSLYIWTHQICSIFKNPQVNIDLSELQRISIIRNKFLTHITEQPLLAHSKSARSGMTLDGTFEDIQLLFHSLSYPQELYDAIEKLAEELKDLIPDLQNQVNFYVRIRIIYENLNKIADGKLKKSAVKVIQNVGLATESPSKIAEALLTALKEYKKSLGL